jgi:hypothetical protein
MDPTHVDALARSLAHPASRRGALGLLVGGALGTLAAGDATATRRRRRAHAHRAVGGAKGGNSACAHFCAQVFGADTPAADACTREAAKGTGLCFQCGPGCGGGTTCIPTGGCCTDADCASPETCGGGGTPYVCGCLTAGTCCADPAACQAQCCSGQSLFVTDTQCASGRLCR